MTNSLETPQEIVPGQESEQSLGRGEPLLLDGSESGASNPVLDRFWVAVKRLPRYLKLAANLARDGHVPKHAKIMLAAGGAYTISPVDLVPGVIPVAGQLDDLVVLLLALRTAVRACPPEVAAAHLERAGLSAADFDSDLAATKETAIWLAGKGLSATRSAARAAGRRAVALWKQRPRAA